MRTAGCLKQDTADKEKRHTSEEPRVPALTEDQTSRCVISGGTGLNDVIRAHNPEVAGGGRHSLTCGCERASSATRAACNGASRLVWAFGPILTGWVVKSCSEPRS
jgi:hypothetical protein